MEANFERESAGDKLAKVFQTYKVVFVGLLVAFVAFIVVFGVANVASSKAAGKDLAVIDSIEYVMTNGSANLKAEELETRRKNALNDLSKFNGKGGIVGVRANMLTAEIKFIQKDFEAAADFWSKAAGKKNKAYTAPLCYFNAAAAYEELNNLDKAAASYEKAVSYKDFDQIAHAKFSLGRVCEAKGDKARALEVYSDLCAATPDDSWAQLAKSRLLALELADKE